MFAKTKRLTAVLGTAAVLSLTAGAAVASAATIADSSQLSKAGVATSASPSVLRIAPGSRGTDA